MNKIKYILHAKEWRDKVNGVTYFSCRITRTSDNHKWSVRFQAGYESYYEQISLELINSLRSSTSKPIDYNDVYSVKESATKKQCMN